MILQNLSAEYFNIAENYLSQKNYSKAIENYKLSLRSAKNENLNQTKYQLARAYALNKDYAEAEDIFYDLYQQEKDNTILAESLAYCYGKNGKLQDSINIYKELYEKVLELSFDADGFGLFEDISDEDAEKALWIAAILEVLNDVPVRRMNHIFQQRNMKYDWEHFLNKYYEE